MAPQPEEERWVQRLLRALARWVLGVFFRRVEVEGHQHLPRDRPVLVVANHVNSLIDAVLLVGSLPRMPRFLGKSTLWKMKPLLPFLKAARVIPVYRRQDPGVDASKNVETFAACYEALAAGESIALFPEGISHNEPELQPLKTGAARIALGAERRFGPLGVAIVPAGMTFDAKGRFRSRALLRFGEAIELEEGTDDEDREAVQQLTTRIEKGIREVTLNYGSWSEARRLERAVDLWALPAPSLPTRGQLSDRVKLRRAFLAGYRRLAREYPQRVARVEAAVSHYDDLLTACGLRDDQVAASYPRHLVARYLFHTLGLLLLRLPLALVGLVLNWLPYRIPGWIAAKMADKPDVQSTYKLFSALFAFPLFWGLEAGLMGHFFGLWPALALLALAPITGWQALHFSERSGGFLAEARAYLLLHGRKDLAQELKSRRATILRQVSELVDLYLQDQAPSPTPS
ncbi:MAG: 1-acyl-sn-glycerol-3-phosphate acyltransferase [Acidobacteriota bacterium]|nr:1-acyl-sn-glycerol-3-phosphate acyltransferase [Acidobacteriota bacterium]